MTARATSCSFHDRSVSVQVSAGELFHDRGRISDRTLLIDMTAESKHFERSPNYAATRPSQHHQPYRLFRIQAILLYHPRTGPRWRAFPPNCTTHLFQRGLVKTCHHPSCKSVGVSARSQGCCSPVCTKKSLAFSLLCWAPSRRLSRTRDAVMSGRQWDTQGGRGPQLSPLTSLRNLTSAVSDGHGKCGHMALALDDVCTY